MGNPIAKKGILSNEALMEKILKVVIPTNKKELEASLGLVNLINQK